MSNISFAMKADGAAQNLQDAGLFDMAETIVMLSYSYDSDPETEYLEHAHLTMALLIDEAAAETDKSILLALMDAYAVVRETVTL